LIRLKTALWKSEAGAKCRSAERLFKGFQMRNGGPDPLVAIETLAERNPNSNTEEKQNPCLPDYWRGLKDLRNACTLDGGIFAAVWGFPSKCQEDKLGI
jgi:hypothetical protein